MQQFFLTVNDSLSHKRVGQVRTVRNTCWAMRHSLHQQSEGNKSRHYLQQPTQTVSGDSVTSKKPAVPEICITMLVFASLCVCVCVSTERGKQWFAKQEIELVLFGGFTLLLWSFWARRLRRASGESSSSFRCLQCPVRVGVEDVETGLRK